VVPAQGKGMVLRELHEAHPGVVRMKLLAQSYVWWPSINRDIENKVQQCHQCQMNQKSPAQVPMHPWEYPQKPWSQLHVDYAGPLLGRMFLIVVDAYSKWLDVHVMNTSTSQATIEKLHVTFANQGLPEVLVSDNASCFTSDEFESFLNKNGIQHVTSPVYHPSSNGLVEWAVQTFKEGMKKLQDSSVQTRVSRFLFHYRTTPQTVTGQSPAELLNSRKYRTALDTLRPDQQAKQKHQQFLIQQTQKRHQRFLHPQCPFYVRDFGMGGSRWQAGTVAAADDSMATIELNDGRWLRRHLDHVRVKSDPERGDDAANT